MNKKISNVSFESTIEINTLFSALVDQYENLKTTSLFVLAIHVPPVLVCTGVLLIERIRNSERCYIFYICKYVSLREPSKEQTSFSV